MENDNMIEFNIKVDEFVQSLSDEQFDILCEVVDSRIKEQMVKQESQEKKIDNENVFVKSLYN